MRLGRTYDKGIVSDRKKKIQETQEILSKSNNL